MQKAAKLALKVLDHVSPEQKKLLRKMRRRTTRSKKTKSQVKKAAVQAQMSS